MRSTLYIVWKDHNNLGIPIIDEQHRGIVSTINSLHHFIHSGHSNEIIKPTMVILEQYTVIHFGAEEALMTKAGYPDFNQHVELHRQLVTHTKKLSLEASRNQDSNMVLKFLKDWWLGHINREDKKYVPFLKKLINPKGL